MYIREGFTVTIHNQSGKGISETIVYKICQIYCKLFYKISDDFFLISQNKKMTKNVGIKVVQNTWYFEEIFFFEN